MSALDSQRAAEAVSARSATADAGATGRPSAATPESQKGNGKRKPGRTPGSPKVEGSGRKPGGRNHVSARTREDVQAIVDRHGPALFQRLFHLALGHKIKVGVGPTAKTTYPSEQWQRHAQEILSRKILPDRHWQQASGREGEPGLKLQLAPDVVAGLGPAAAARFGVKVEPTVADAAGNDVDDAPQMNGTPVVTPSDIVADDEIETVEAEPVMTSTVLPKVGDLFEVSGCTGRAWVRLASIETNGNERWWVLDARGDHRGTRASRADAEHKARQLFNDGLLPEAPPGGAQPPRSAQDHDDGVLSPPPLTHLYPPPKRLPRVITRYGDHDDVD